MKRIDYRCVVCEQPKPREDLAVKKTVFHEIGRGGRMIRSRTIGWICSECRKKDPDWNREPWAEAPGTTQWVEGES